MLLSPLELKDRERRDASPLKPDTGTSTTSEETLTEATPTADKAASKTRSPEAHALLGQRVGDYRVEKQIGHGSMGEVFLATQVFLRRSVALKTLTPKFARQPEFVERFLREMRWMAQFDHPGIVKVFDVSQHSGMPYAALEFIDGRNLQSWLVSLGKVAIGDAVLITLLCAEALEYAHSKGIVHRDVKSGNILIGSTGAVKLTDFGLVKAAEDVSLTRTGIGMGTPQYMAPEQIRDAKHADVRTDIYALGSTLYQLVTGEYPFRQTDTLSLLKAKLKGQFEPARTLNPQVPEKLDLLISKMLDTNPASRHASCAELIRELGELHLASDSLSFVASPNKMRYERPWLTNVASAAPAMPMRRTPSSPQPEPLTPGERLAAQYGFATKIVHSGVGSRVPSQPVRRKRKQAASTAAGEWFVRHRNAKNQIVIDRMSTDEVLRGILTKYLDLNASAKLAASGPFRPLRDFEPFRKAMDDRLAKCKVVRRGRDDKTPFWARSEFWTTMAALFVLSSIAYAIWSSQRG